MNVKINVIKREYTFRVLIDGAEQLIKVTAESEEAAKKQLPKEAVVIERIEEDA